MQITCSPLKSMLCPQKGSRLPPSALLNSSVCLFLQLLLYLGACSASSDSHSHKFPGLSGLKDQVWTAEQPLFSAETTSVDVFMKMHNFKKQSTIVYVDHKSLSLHCVQAFSGVGSKFPNESVAVMRWAICDIYQLKLKHIR